MANAIGRYVTLLVVDFLCSLVPKQGLLQLSHDERFEERGLYVAGIEYEIFIAELKRHAQARALITDADETVRDPGVAMFPRAIYTAKHIIPVN